MSANNLRHDLCLNALADVASNLGFSAKKEVLARKLSDNNSHGSKRLDIVVHLPNKTLGIDVSVCNPTVPSVVEECSKRALAAVSTREREKASKYKGITEQFLSFAVDSYGAFGEQAKKVIEELHDNCESSRHRPKAYTRRRLAIVLQRGNAALYRAAALEHSKCLMF